MLCSNEHLGEMKFIWREILMDEKSNIDWSNKMKNFIYLKNYLKEFTNISSSLTENEDVIQIIKQQQMNMEI